MRHKMPARRPVPSLALLVSRHLAATLLDRSQHSPAPLLTVVSRFCQCGDQVEDWAAGVSLLLHQHLQQVSQCRPDRHCTCAGQGVYEEMVELLLAALDRDFANMPELRPRARQVLRRTLHYWTAALLFPVCALPAGATHEEPGLHRPPHRGGQDHRPQPVQQICRAVSQSGEVQ